LTSITMRLELQRRSAQHARTKIAAILEAEGRRRPHGKSKRRRRRPLKQTKTESTRTLEDPEKFLPQLVHDGKESDGLNTPMPMTFISPNEGDHVAVDQEPAMKTVARPSRPYLICCICKRLIFQYVNSDGRRNKICVCHPDFIFGCFWQELTESGSIHTFACCRVKEQNYWARASTPAGHKSVARMVVNLADGRQLRFGPLLTQHVAIEEADLLK
jgi:hypothetical protein